MDWLFDKQNLPAVNWLTAVIIIVGICCYLVVRMKSMIARSDMNSHLLFLTTLTVLLAGSPYMSYRMDVEHLASVDLYQRYGVVSICVMVVLVVIQFALAARVWYLYAHEAQERAAKRRPIHRV